MVFQKTIQIEVKYQFRMCKGRDWVSPEEVDDIVPFAFWTNPYRTLLDRLPFGRGLGRLKRPDSSRGRPTQQPAFATVERLHRWEIDLNSF